MSILSGLFGGKPSKPWTPTPLQDPFTAQYMQGIDTSGLGAQNRIYQTFGDPLKQGSVGTAGGTMLGGLASRGWMNSSAAQNIPIATGRAREQALLDLNSQLYSQRLGAMQAGTQNALQQLSINENSRNAAADRKLRKRMASDQLLGSALGGGFSAAFQGSSPYLWGTPTTSGPGPLATFFGFA